jgi:integrase
VLVGDHHFGVAAVVGNSGNRLVLTVHEVTPPAGRQVLRSSVQTVNRYRTATDHLLRFLEARPVRYASQFHVRHADLSPYAENPFGALGIDCIPVQEARPIHLFTAEQERAFLEACDDWQLPLFLTLMLTGLRPGELTHLLLPDDLDLTGRLLRVRNKPRLGWQVKTRNERDIPLVPALAAVLRAHLGCRAHGPVFRRRRWKERAVGPLGTASPDALGEELARRVADQEAVQGQPLTRVERGRVARQLWREVGAVKGERVRLEFLRRTRAIGLPGCTAPKALRHLFATALQEGRVDPLIRNELMGHVAAGARSAGHGLAMTAVYTHTRPEVRRQQLEAALAQRPAVAVAQAWLRRQGPSLP